MALIKEAINAPKNVHTKFGLAISTHSPLVVRQSRGTGASIRVVTLTKERCLIERETSVLSITSSVFYEI